MKKYFTLTLLLLACAYGFAQSNYNEDEVVKIEWYNQHATKEGELIVKFADHTTLRLQNNERGALQATGMSRVDALLKQYPVAKAERLCPNDDPKRELKVSKSYNGPDVVERDLSRLCRFVMEDPRQTYDMVQALKELDEVEFAEPNYMVFALGMESKAQPRIPFYAPYGDKSLRDGGSYFNPEAYMAEPMYSLQWGLEAVHLPELWASDTVTSNSDRPVIAILDTGVDIDHPDLAANIWTNPGETENGYDDDNNGFADDLHGWDFVNQTADMHDWNSHGTHCAGIAAAVGDNGIGITGANPNALIMPIAVLQSNGTGDIATVIQGINYAKNNGADVLSMSFGSYSYSIALEQALAQAYQNAVLVAAAGNDGCAMRYCCGTCLDMFPAAFTFVFGVQATNQGGGLAGFSNYDCTGPSFSVHGEEQLYNYELSAPGTGVYSTVPNGNYRSYNGTSMATPLVAGGISALLHAKPYLSQEMLWGDLINTTTEFHPVNFKACYDAGEAPAQLQFVTYEMNDTIGGDGDFRPDAGETIYLYPTLRTTWGATNDITMWLTLSEFENPNIITFLDTDPVDFGWSLLAYAKSKSVNPVRFTINPDCVDGRIINLELHVTASNALEELVFPFSIQVENGVELSGLITDTVTLYPNVHYIVTRSLGVTNSGLLIIKPGTTLLFQNDVGLSCIGRISAIGTPDSTITFTTNHGFRAGEMLFNDNDTLEYCLFENVIRIQSARGDWQPGNPDYPGPTINHSVIRFCGAHDYDVPNFMWGTKGSGCCFYYNTVFNLEIASHRICNVISNVYTNEMSLTLGGDISGRCNVFRRSTRYQDNFDFIFDNNLPSIIYIKNYYLGSGIENVIRRRIYDMEYPGSNSLGLINLDSISHNPIIEAPGIVWKVLVNGYDAQDEFEQLPPLGCGRHLFEVYFSKPMDTLITPFVALGVRPPYTQHAIAEDGHWNEEGTIFTAYLTIDGTTVTDGLNRIYVANAKDNEYFEIPVENMRFNVQVSAAGSLSAEFMATPGLGKVDLEWNNNEVDFQDFLGYNMYRYVYDSVLVEGHYDENGNWIEAHNEWMATDSIQLNTALIQDTLFTDYDVLPGQRYYYYYKVLRTNLTEGVASRVVTTVPLTATMGDANGSMAVDVADVVSIVSYLTNGNPQPFIFEAADVNADGNIDILDIVGVINIIMNRGELPDALPVATAYYSIENGYLFVDTPVELGGVQFVLNGIDSQNIEVLQALEGFEQVKADVSDGTLFMAYSMSGKRLPVGKHALLRIGEGTIGSVALSDPEGHNVLAILSGTGIEEHETLFLEQPYPNPFNGNLTIPFIIGDERANNVVFTVTNMMGQVVSVIELGSRTRGEYKYEWKPAASMATGIYTVSMQVNGRNVQRAKVVYVN